MTDYKFTLIEAHGYWNAMSPPDLKVGDTIEIIAEKTGSDIVRELLKNGKPVLCLVSNISQDDADRKFQSSSEIIAINEFSGEHFKEDYAWKYASPVDTSLFASYGSEVKE